MPLRSSRALALAQRPPTLTAPLGGRCSPAQLRLADQEAGEGPHQVHLGVGRQAQLLELLR